MNEEKRINFGIFETEVLPDRIIDRILELIKSKQLQPGDKLPPERELAEMMQVGRQTLRAALRAGAIRALRFEDFFFFEAFFLAGFLLAVFFLLAFFRALAIVFSFEFTGFVRLFCFLFHLYQKTFFPANPVSC